MPDLWIHADRFRRGIGDGTEDLGRSVFLRNSCQLLTLRLRLALSDLLGSQRTRRCFSVLRRFGEIRGFSAARWPSYRGFRDLAARFLLAGWNPSFLPHIPGKHAHSREPEKEEAGATSVCLVATAGVCSSAAQRRVFVCLLQLDGETLVLYPESDGHGLQSSSAMDATRKSWADRRAGEGIAS